MDPNERRLIEQDCERLATTYPICLDFRRFERLLGLFTEAGTLDIDGHAIAGKDALGAYMNQRPVGRTTRHVSSNILIDVIDEDRASGIAYLTGYRFDAADLTDATERRRAPFDGPFVVGHYDDDYVRTPDGWRFERRRVTPTFMRPFSFDVWSEVWK